MLPAKTRNPLRRVALLWPILSLIGLSACDSAAQPARFEDEDECTIDPGLLVSGGVPKDGIPALTNPELVSAEDAPFMSDRTRVIGLRVKSEFIAIPHQILWHHEIVNLDFRDLKVAVTYCPLTGSSMAFDRASVGGGEFGVSGLLYQNNLTMYDRTSQESLWPQMNREAGCGPRVGQALEMVPIVEMTWPGWLSLHPNTKVISSDTGFSRNYRASGYPYGTYERIDNDRLLFPMRIDDRRPPKERVLGVPAGSGGIAFPFGLLDDGSARRVIRASAAGESILVFWDREREAAMAFRDTAGEITFEVRDGKIVDTATLSEWGVDGRAVSGTMRGRSIEPIAEAYVAFWFAWAQFQPETILWGDVP